MLAPLRFLKKDNREGVDSKAARMCEKQVNYQSRNRNSRSLSPPAEGYTFKSLFANFNQPSRLKLFYEFFYVLRELSF
jgi:hypothetical protein